MAKLIDFNNFMCKGNMLCRILTNNDIAKNYQILVQEYSYAIQYFTAESFDELYELTERTEGIIKKLENIFRIYWKELEGKSEQSESICNHIRFCAKKLYNSNCCDKIPEFNKKTLSRIFLQDIRIWCKDSNHKKNSTTS